MVIPRTSPRVGVASRDGRTTNRRGRVVVVEFEFEFEFEFEGEREGEGECVDDEGARDARGV